MTDGWQKKSLESVTTKITDGSHNPPRGVDKSNFLMLNSKNVFDDNLHYDAPRYLSEKNFGRKTKERAWSPVMSSSQLWELLVEAPWFLLKRQKLHFNEAWQWFGLTAKLSTPGS
jgi:hypothetical protein